MDPFILLVFLEAEEKDNFILPFQRTKAYLAWGAGAGRKTCTMSKFAIT